MIADVRVIAATNSNLKEEVVLKQFHEDLFYCLNVLTVSVSSLRERGTDALHLAEPFLTSMPPGAMAVALICRQRRGKNDSTILGLATFANLTE